MKIIAHGGVGSSRELDPHVMDAVKEGSRGAEDALSAVVGVVSKLEDEPMFNAGTGSRMRLDGSIQMDAAVMYRGEIGAVGALERVKNPVQVAAEIYRGPYVFLVGDDAKRFARGMGFETYDPSTEKRREELLKMQEKLNNHEDLKKIYDVVDGGDTVGCAASFNGEYAAAVSTGGTSYCIRGRIGDSPLVGCGFYAGERGAVITTGKGEEIIKDLTAYRCYELIPEYGLSGACEKMVEEFNKDVTIGVIAVGEEGTAAASSKDMSQSNL
ncbi:MAG: isoaspartyl peptidase/L-asparaginase [Thermoplasmata archaeon]